MNTPKTGIAWFDYAHHMSDEDRRAFAAAEPIFTKLVSIAHERMPDEHGHPQRCIADIAAHLEELLDKDPKAALLAAAEAIARLGYFNYYRG